MDALVHQEKYPLYLQELLIVDIGLAYPSFDTLRPLVFEVLAEGQIECQKCPSALPTMNFLVLVTGFPVLGLAEKATFFLGNF